MILFEDVRGNKLGMIDLYDRYIPFTAGGVVLESLEWVEFLGQADNSRYVDTAFYLEVKNTPGSIPRVCRCWYPLRMNQRECVQLVREFSARGQQGHSSKLKFVSGGIHLIIVKEGSASNILRAIWKYIQPLLKYSQKTRIVSEHEKRI